MWNEIINDIMSSSTIRRNPEDYIKDGLLYCGKCNTPKQCRIEVFGKVKKPYCLCNCATAERDREERADRERAKRQRIGDARIKAFGDSALVGWNFTKDTEPQSKISKVARRYVDNFPKVLKDGQGLCFFGSVGSGKTFYSACILNAVLDMGYTGLCTNFATIASRKFKEDTSDLTQVDLLVIDDFGAERDTSYMTEAVHDVIDGRYRSKKPLIITTNLTADELKNPADVTKQRIYSRVLEMCIPIEVTGVDKRREHLKQQYKQYQELLGL